MGFVVDKVTVVENFCHILSCFTSQYHSSGVPLSLICHLYSTALVKVSGV